LNGRSIGEQVRSKPSLSSKRASEEVEKNPPRLIELAKQHWPENSGSKWTPGRDLLMNGVRCSTFVQFLFFISVGSG